MALQSQHAGAVVLKLIMPNLGPPYWMYWIIIYDIKKTFLKAHKVILMINFVWEPLMLMPVCFAHHKGHMLEKSPNSQISFPYLLWDCSRMWKQTLGVFAYRNHSLTHLFIQYTYIKHILGQGIVLCHKDMKMEKIGF